MDCRRECFDVADGLIYLMPTVDRTWLPIFKTVIMRPAHLSVRWYFSVMARESDGCKTLEDDVVVGPDPIVVNAAAQAETCVGDNNGEVSWTQTGGTGAYTFEFDGEVVTGVSAEGLEPGTYDVMVTDANSCSVTETVEVEGPWPPTSAPVSPMRHVSGATTVSLWSMQLEVQERSSTVKTAPTTSRTTNSPVCRCIYRVCTGPVRLH